MKVRILSDLHLDLNSPFSLADRDLFTIICGDISAHNNQSVRWINENITQGVFVEDNHIGYHSAHSIQYLENFFAKYYPVNADVSYLKNTYKIVNDIVFVGGILWTNFELFANKDLAMFSAKKCLNDFNYNYFNSDYITEETEYNFDQLKAEGKIRILKPIDTVSMFTNTFLAIKSVCEQFKNKKVVVITHHAPSMESISPEYKNDCTSAAFASSLEDFILDHSNIKLWCHGHIHSASDYLIGECRIICNPLGYEASGEQTGFNSNLVIDL